MLSAFFCRRGIFFLRRSIFFLRRGRFRFLLVLTDDYRACRFTAGLFAPGHGCGSTAWGSLAVYHKGRGTMTVVTVGKNDDPVRLMVTMTRRRRPPRMCGRTMSGSRPVPFIPEIEPALVIRDVFILVENVAVIRDVDLLRAGHDDRAWRRGRDDLLRAGDDDRFFYDDRLFHDSRGSFHDDRSRTRLDNRAYQVHDVCRELDAVGRGFMMIPGESGCRSEDDRRGESGADGECPVDGLLSRVSYGREVDGFQSENRLFLTS